MKKIRVFIGSTTLTLVLFANLTTITYANPGHTFYQRTLKSNHEKQAILNALKNQDYKTWKQAISESKLEEYVNKEKFLKLSDAYKQENQNYRFSQKNLNNVKIALEKNDYEMWKKAMTGNTRMLMKIDTSEKFQIFVQAFNETQKGNFEEAKKLRETINS